MVLLVGTGLVVLRVKFHGPALADQIESLLNRRMRGRIEIASIEWPMSDVRKVITGGWVSITMRDVTVWDRRADERTRDCFEDAARGETPPPRRVLEVPVMTAQLDVHALMFGRHDLVFTGVDIPGGKVRIEQVREPYPLHAYDRTSVSLVAAFLPCMQPGFRAGFYADKPPPIFDVRDITFGDLDVDILIGPDEAIPYDAAEGPFYTTTLSLTDVSAEHAFLYMDPTDPLVSRMYFSIAPTTGPGVLRMWDSGVKPADSFLPSWASAGLPDAHQPIYSIELTRVDVRRLAQLPDEWPRSGVANNLRLEGTLHTDEGATIEIAGDLIDWWDRQFDGTWNLDVAARNLGPTLRDDIMPGLGGDAATANLRLRGPFIALPKLEFELDGLEYDVVFANPTLPVMQLELAQLTGWVDFVNENGSLDKTIATASCVRDAKKDRCGPKPAGGDVPGTVELSASFGLPLNLNANLDITHPIDLGPWLPPTARDAFGRYLRGRMRATGKSETRLALAGLDLVLGRTRTERLTHVHGGEILTEQDFDTIELAGLRVDSGATAMRVDGSVSFSNAFFGFNVAGNSNDLALWLRRIGAPPVATAAHDARIDIEGRWVDGELQLAVGGRARLRGVPTVDQVDVVARLEDDLLFIDSLDSTGLGGKLVGSGQIRVGARPFIDRLDLEGEGLTIDKLPGGGAITGTIRSAKLTARGSLTGKRDIFDWFGITSGYLVSDDIAVLGDRYQDAALCINYPDDELCRRPGTAIDAGDAAACDAAKHGGACLVGRAARADGGALDITLASPARGKAPRGKKAPSPPLTGALAVRDAPLEIITRMLDQAAVPVGGSVSAALRFGGTRAAPTADGTVQLLRAWVLDAFVGDSTLAIAPDPDDPSVVEIRGKALHGRLDLVARVGTSAPYPIDVTLSGRRVEIDPLIDLSAALGLGEPVRAWASGTITLHAELGSKAEPYAWVELDELGAVLDHRDPDGRQLPLRVTALAGIDGRKAVSVRATPSSIALVCRDPDAPRASPTPCSVRLATPAGVLTVSGSASPAHLALAAAGTVDLRLIAPLVDVYFDEVSGTAELSATLGGTPEKPEPAAELLLADVRLRPVGQETVVRVPAGLIKLGNGSLGFSDVRIRVDDTYLGEKAELVVKGGLGMDGLRPAKWGVIIEGQIAGKMLLAVAPQLFSQASGVAHIDGAVLLTGDGELPGIEGALRFDDKQPLIVIPRGLRRELAFKGGTLAVGQAARSTNKKKVYEIDIDGVQGSIDGEGTLRDISGLVEIADGALAAFEVVLDADAIPFRIPRTLDLVINADRLRIERRDPTSKWAVSGRKIELVTGRYIRQFDVGEVITPTASTSSSKPVWEEYPELGAATIDIPIDVRQFSVANNIAAIHMAGSNLRLTGTPRDPRIEGTIRIQQGSFRFPGMRAKFTETEGTVQFQRLFRIPADTPALEITSTANYRDPSGTDHLITAHLSGTLTNLTWDLYTSTGFDKTQTLSLLLLGKTSEQLRASVGDQTLGADPTRLDPTTNPTGNPLDQVMRDVAGDTISLLVEDSLKEVSRLDVARPFVTFGSWGFHGEKRVLENINIVGDYEQTTRGGRSINVRGELGTPWSPVANGRPIQLQYNYLNKSFEDAVEDDVKDHQFKLVYRFFVQ